MSIGLILFGHGARDPRWREPFDRLEKMVSQAHAGPVSLAFLELKEPNLSGAAQLLVSRGATRIVVVPLFLGTGGHIRRDLPLLLEETSVACNVPVNAVTPVGEDPTVIESLAQYCLLSVNRSLS